MKFLGSFPREQLEIVIDFLQKEKLAYRTSTEMIPLGRTTVPSGNVILEAEYMDSFQQVEYAKVAMPTLDYDRGAELAFRRLRSSAQSVSIGSQRPAAKSASAQAIIRFTASGLSRVMRSSSRSNSSSTY
jgi:hypothetical protein